MRPHTVLPRDTISDGALAVLLSTALDFSRKLAASALVVVRFSQLGKRVSSASFLTRVTRTVKHEAGRSFTEFGKTQKAIYSENPFKYLACLNCARNFNIVLGSLSSNIYTFTIVFIHLTYMQALTEIFLL